VRWARAGRSSARARSRPTRTGWPGLWPSLVGRCGPSWRWWAARSGFATRSPRRAGRSRSLTRAKVHDVAPLACKTDKVDARVLAELCRCELVPALCVPSL